MWFVRGDVRTWAVCWLLLTSLEWNDLCRLDAGLLQSKPWYGHDRKKRGEKGHEPQNELECCNYPIAPSCRPLKTIWFESRSLLVHVLLCSSFSPVCLRGLPKAGNFILQFKIFRQDAFTVTQLREVMSHHAIEDNRECLKDQSPFKVVSGMFESVCVTEGEINWVKVKNSTDIFRPLQMTYHLLGHSVDVWLFPYSRAFSMSWKQGDKILQYDSANVAILI